MLAVIIGLSSLFNVIYDMMNDVHWETCRQAASLM